MHKLYELKEMLCKELEEYGSKELTPGSLEVVDKLSHAIKNIGKIIEMYEEEEEGGGSSYGYEGGSSYRRGGGGGSSRAGRESDQSRARGRGRNARRDSMGRYSSEGGNYGGGSSRYAGGGSSRYAGGGSSYADGMEEMAESIKEMMGELPENIQREAQKFVQKLEQEMM